MRTRLTYLGVALIFVASGTSGLVFELIWLKQLATVVGHTTLAASLVVSAFLGGLVLGSFFLGARADRVRSPLLAYAFLEAATAASALGLTALLRILPELLASAGIPGGGPLPLRALLSFVLVLPPTFAMGGTLPLLTRFLSRELSQVGRSFGLLYALNTLGAAAGCGLAGFWLLGSIGLWATACVAAGVNVAVALSAVALSFLGGGAALAEITAPAGDPLPKAAAPAQVGAADLEISRPAPGRARTGFLAAFALCGFCSIALELLWFRVLQSFVESSSYAFTVLLCTYLVGLVLGGLLYTTFLARRRGLALFAAVEAALAFAALGSVALLGQARPLAALLADAFPPGPLTPYLGLLCLAALVLLPPTTLIGVIFPLTVDLTTDHLGVVGARVGLLYAVNTLGGIAGSLAAGLLLVPLLGTQGSFLLVSGLCMAVALGVQRLDSTATARDRRATVATAGLLAVAALILPTNYLTSALSGFVDSRVLWVREGRDGTVAVLEYDRDTVCASDLYDCAACDPGEVHHRQILFGSVSYANTVLPGRRYMAALAHLPMLAHEKPEQVLEVCFGTGTTAGTFTLYDELEKLTVVDVNADVFEAARFFTEANRDVLENPRVEHHVDDGRHFLLAGEARYDVISFEPPPPRAAGASTLFTREFYELIRSRLAPGGLLTQWIPLQEQSDGLDRELVQAILAVFPETALFIPCRFEAVLLASTEPLRLDLDRFRARAGRPEVAAALAEVGFDSPEALLGTFVVGPEGLGRWAAGHQPVTDDLPGVEYFLSRPQAPFSLDALLAVSDGPGPLLVGPPDEQALAAQRAAALLLLEANRSVRRQELGRARAQVEEARAAGGENAYVRYLLEQELGCAVRRVPVTGLTEPP